MKTAPQPLRTSALAINTIRKKLQWQIPAALSLAALLSTTQLAEATAYTWVGTSGNNYYWSVDADWSPNTGAPGGSPTTDTAIFGSGDTSSSSTTVNNVVNSSVTIAGLTYTNFYVSGNSAIYNVTQIPTGQTLTVNGPVLVGGVNGVSSDILTQVYMTGGGTFVATGSTFTVQDYDNTTAEGAAAFLNLSGLSYFVYNNNAGTISIEDNPGSNTRLGGNMTLAGASNSITVKNLNLGTSTAAQAGAAGTLTLGAGTNVISVANLTIGSQKSTYTVAGTPGGGLWLRGLTGAATDGNVIVIVGDKNVSSASGTCTGNLLLDGCPVNIMASSLTIGQCIGSPSTTDGSAGLVQFDTGTITVTNISIASNSIASSSATANGSLVVGSATNTGATLIVGTGGISLVNDTSTGVATGTLTIFSGGTVTNSGNLTTSPTGTSTINLGGSLEMAAGTSIGSSAAAISALSLSNSATLQIGVPSNGAPAYVNALIWPANDSTLTINIVSLPAGVTSSSTYTLIQVNSSFSGTFNSYPGGATVAFPGLPSGYVGNLSQNGNSIQLNITAVPPPPSVPANFTATPGNAQVALTWNASTGVPPITYDVSRSTNSGEETLLAAGITATNYTDTNAVNGITYYYVVNAVNGNNVPSAFATEVNATPVGPPPAPTGVVGSIQGNDQLVLNWTASFGATSYNILRATNLSGPYTTIATNVTGTTYTDTTASTSVTLYYYEVVAVDGNGTGPNSTPQVVPYGEGNQLVNPSFEDTLGSSGWTLLGNANVQNTNGYYDNSTNGECAHDPTTEHVVAHDGTNVGNLYGQFNGSPNHSSFSQEVTSAPGATWAAGGWTFASHEDLSGVNSYYYEVDFLSLSGALLASYESYVVNDLTCGETTPFPVDTWVFLSVTNQMQVTGGTNTGTVIGTVPTGILIAPSNTATARFQAIFYQPAEVGGSIFLDDAELDLISGPVPPSISAISPNGITLCTNRALTCTAQSGTNTLDITNVIVTVATYALGGPTNYVTNGSQLTVTGLGTSSVNISNALTTNLFYDVTVVVADSYGISSTASASFDTLSPTLVIEASDFNFSSGQYFDTPPNGGLALYTNQVGAQGIDENKGSRTASHSYYRPDDAVVIQDADPGTYTEQKFITAAAAGDSIDVEQEVGYNSPGDWLNYTRTYGSGGSAPAGTYNVWLYSAQATGGVQANLCLVTSDPTQGSQTTNLFGSFGTTNFGGSGGYTEYGYVQLVDTNGNPAAITLSGTNTLKSVVVGNPNLAFYLLTPAVSPSLLTVYPNGPFEGTNKFSFTISANSGASILSNGISLILNGVNVTSGLTFTKVGNTWVVSYPLQPNSIYTAVIQATNTAQLSVSYPVTFDTIDINNYQWEAVDYDFTTNGVSALFIDNPVPTCDTNTFGQGELETNSYFGYPEGLSGVAIAQPGIDINWTNLQTAPSVSDYYRDDGVGSQPATDYLRPKFLAEQQALGDPNIGPFNIGYFDAGNWLNYTRHYPTNNFYVWGRIAGGGGPFSGTSLSLVTSGVGTSNQTTTVLGTFSDANPAGWQVYHWIPLLDANSNMVVVSLGGQATLRLTSGAELNAEYFMLVPQFKLTASVVAGQLHLSFPAETGFTYAIMYKSSLSAPSWTQVGATITGDGTQEVVESLAGTQGYYTVVTQ